MQQVRVHFFILFVSDSLHLAVSTMLALSTAVITTCLISSSAMAQRLHGACSSTVML